MKHYLDGFDDLETPIIKVDLETLRKFSEKHRRLFLEHGPQFTRVELSWTENDPIKELLDTG